MPTIGEIKDKLRCFAVDTPLTWSGNDEMGFRILDKCSYRGYYNQAALVVELVNIEIADNVSHLIKCLDALLSESFTGYKGGEYEYSNETELYLVEDYSGTQFRDKCRTLKVKEDGTFKDKKSNY